MKKFSFIVMLLWVLAVSGVQAQSRVLTDTIHSKVLNADRAYTVYLPDGFDKMTEREWPVLYLLHGMWDNNLSWKDRGSLQAVADRLMASGEARKMVIVTPNAGGNVFEHQNGYFDMPGWNYERFFFEEFVPFFEKKYRVASDREHRAVAGLSMGGGGATRYAQLHPDMFCAAFAMSALMSIPQNGAAKPRQKGDKLDILTRSVMVNSCVEHVRNATPETVAALRTVAWFVDCGDDDFLLDRNIEFYQAMRHKGIPCQFRVRDGGHDWEYWHGSLYECLRFVSFRFAR